MHGGNSTAWMMEHSPHGPTSMHLKSVYTSVSKCVMFRVVATQPASHGPLACVPHLMALVDLQGVCT